MKNIVFIPAIDAGRGRHHAYKFSINSWKQWAEKNNAEVLVWDEALYDWEHEKFKGPVAFGFTSDKFGEIKWSYKDQEKQWHQTGLVKRNDIVVLTKLSAADEKEVIDEMMVELEKANQLVKDRANALARKRRAAT